jgi:hypothetical protein
VESNSTTNVTDQPQVKTLSEKDEYTTREKGFIVGLVILGFFNVVFMVVIAFLLWRFKSYIDRPS